MEFRYSWDVSHDLSSVEIGMLITLIIVGVVFALGFYILNAIFMGKLFRKAGVPFWKAWVPIYNVIKFLQIGGQNPLYILFNLIPIVGTIVFYVFMCISAHNIDKKLGKDDVFLIIYIFFGIVWVGINGLDKSTWKDSRGVASLAPETVKLKSK